MAMRGTCGEAVGDKWESLIKLGDDPKAEDPAWISLNMIHRGTHYQQILIDPQFVGIVHGACLRRTLPRSFNITVSHPD